MGLFNNTKKKEVLPSLPDVPELPEIPELPELPNLDAEDRSIHQLPKIPSSSFGERFSQNAIKEAISGKNEDELGGLEADEFATNEDMQGMQRPLKKKFTREVEEHNYEEDIPSTRESFKNHVMEKSFQQKYESRYEPRPERTFEEKKKEPVFVRIDKFEESLKTFEDTRKRIIEIRKTLDNIKNIKEKEQVELDNWEKEIQEIKRKLERIDADIFSKV